MITHRSRPALILSGPSSSSSSADPQGAAQTTVTKKLSKAIAALRDRAGGGSPADAGLAAPAPETERRQVAVLFADLAGYTRISAACDPEDLHAL
jgi:class 3 adenylate cyclase